MSKVLHAKPIAKLITRIILNHAPFKHFEKKASINV